MNKKIFFTIIVALIFCVSGCSEYQKLLKSDDNELKFNKAMEYFNKKKYVQSQTLLDEVKSYYKGSERSQEVLYYLGRSFYGQKDYTSASGYFQTYMRTYPKGNYAPEVKFLIAKSYYLDSPDAKLDQAITNDGIVALQDYIDMYPQDTNVSEAMKMLDDLNDKLAYKQVLNAKLYYNLGDYLGNNYLSAVIVAQNALKEFPSTQYREDLSFIILQSKYAQAANSVTERQTERYQETIDEYYSFINEFPQGKNRNAADKIFREANKK
ncbi:MAG: outer membrane protein assembly factor BamD [Prevotellaceae bacterium]|jgi:outer membrane protein assembly factor BamD|nr:outer membrane protein assembly factor BamD [Prevotellaceae bacterium]